MSSMPLETCWAFNKFWNNKFYYKVASCWLFLLIHTTMHGSINIKCMNVILLHINHRWGTTRNSSEWFTVQLKLSFTSFQSSILQVQRFYLLVSYTHLYDTFLLVHLAKIIRFFNFGFIPTLCHRILAVTTLKMATLVTEICRWFLYNRITFIHSSAFVGLLKIMYLIKYTGYGAYETNKEELCGNTSRYSLRVLDALKRLRIIPTMTGFIKTDWYLRICLQRFGRQIYFQLVVSSSGRLPVSKRLIVSANAVL